MPLHAATPPSWPAMASGCGEKAYRLRPRCMGGRMAAAAEPARGSGTGQGRKVQGGEGGARVCL